MQVKSQTPLLNCLLDISTDGTSSSTCPELFAPNLFSLICSSANALNISRWDNCLSICPTQRCQDLPWLFAFTYTHGVCSTYTMEKETGTHSSTLAWEVPWTEEPGGLQSMGSRRVRYDWVTKHGSTTIYNHSVLLSIFPVICQDNLFVSSPTFSILAQVTSIFYPDCGSVCSHPYPDPVHFSQQPEWLSQTAIPQIVSIPHVASSGGSSLSQDLFIFWVLDETQLPWVSFPWLLSEHPTFNLHNVHQNNVSILVLLFSEYLPSQVK